MSIAVVDHDEAILDAVKMVLETDGCTIQTYTTGEAFLEDHQQQDFDCIILDPYLPGLSGAGVARSLAGTNGQVPIIGLTARPGSDMATELTNAGACVMLTKPVTAELLLHHVRNVIDPASHHLT